jgi:hypothetical protein
LETYKKYNPTYNKKAVTYILFHFILALSLASALLFTYSKLTIAQLVAASAFVLLTLTTCGALLEQRNWIMKFEYFRLIFWIGGTFLFMAMPFFNMLIASSVILAVLSFFWLNKTLKKVVMEEVTA